MYADTEAAASALLAYGTDPHLLDNNGNTALMRGSDPKRQRLLLRAGADPAIRNHRGNTVLFNWVMEMDIPLLEEYLSLGCPLDEPNLEGFTPLMRVASFYQGHLENRNDAIMFLLEKGADPNRKDNKGKSVLYHYLKTEVRGYPDKDDETVVAALLAAGARPADMDDEGDSVLLYLFEEARWNSEMKPLLRLALKYASADEIKIARAAARKIRREDFLSDLSENLLPTVAALSVPLLVGGLSVGMREGVFANNRSGNFMGPVNAFLTLGLGGSLLGKYSL